VFWYYLTRFSKFFNELFLLPRPEGLDTLSNVREINELFGGSSVAEQLAVAQLQGYTMQCMAEKRTYADRAEYLKKAVAKRRKKLRMMAIAYLGNQCQMCGYNKCKSALDFHHRNPKMKDFGLSQNGMTRSWEKTKTELEKCVLVCANCHREIHDGITQLPMETSE